MVWWRGRLQGAGARAETARTTGFQKHAAAATVLMFSVVSGLAMGGAEVTVAEVSATQQPILQPAKKTCRLKASCDPIDLIRNIPVPSEPSPEQIMNRLREALRQQEEVTPVTIKAAAPVEEPKEATISAEGIAVIAAPAQDAETAVRLPTEAQKAAVVALEPEEAVTLAAAEPEPVVIKATEPAPKLRKKAKAPALKPAEQNMNRAAVEEPFGEGTPFAISVDGETLVNATVVDSERKTDVGLSDADIQVKYDGLDITQVLNASHETGADGKTRLLGHLNYPDFVSKAEFRVYRMKNGEIADLIETIPAGPGFQADFAKGTSTEEELSYVLRVYDDKGRFDETRLIPLDKSTAARGDSVISGPNADKDMTASRNIPVHGGSVTVYGRNVPEGYGVKVLGEEIRTDSNNSFVTQKILPPGDHDVDVAVYGAKDEGLSFSRQVNIPDNEWFYVGLADLTAGYKFKGKIENANTGEFKRTYTKGRLAFYLKGKIKGKYLLTAAADTGEGPLKGLFTGWDRKDPRYILRSLDPDDYYPVYGDDSTLVEDAPTKGKFYVRLARGESHVMWGNFKTRITGTKFAATERALYGAGARFRSEGATSFGEAKTKVDLYAAEPGTVPQRDNFQGTGGSAYFLKRQQITTGSEQVTVEVRDPLTGRVLATRTLKAGEDYDIDYIQGVIILRTPLASTSGDATAVSNGTLGNNTQHLVVNYEYSPALGKDDGQIYGGRVSQWLGDHVEVGITGNKDTSGTADNEVLEADLRLRMSDNTYFEAEIAQSKGQGRGQHFSTDGGLTFNEELPVGSPNKTARAYRLKAVADLGDFNERFNGKAEAYYEQREAGFSALDLENKFAQRIYGGSFKIDVTESLRLSAALDAIEEDGDAVTPSRELYEAVIEADAQITDTISLLAGVRWSDYRDPSRVGRNGTRTDIGARITYEVSENTKVFVFGQTTAQLKGDRLRNDRIGVGAETKLTDRLSVTGSVSTGTSGVGAEAVVTYESSPENKSFVGYKLDPDRDSVSTGGTDISGGRDSGVIVAGSRRKMNEWLSAFSESNADFFGGKRSLTQVYGITFAPDEIWSASLGMELGTVTDALNGDFDRKGFSAKAGYTTDEVSASAALEARFEDSTDGKRDRNTYLMRAQTSWKTNENWRLLAHVDALLSNSDQDTILDGDYVEASIGYAYRPIENDRLNVLFKYAFLYDLPGPQQVNASGEVLGPAQRSHVLSVDGSYDINEYLTIGAKYGFRFGEVSTSRLTQDFTTSSAHLGIVRLDVNVVKNWDALVEGRVLYASETQQTYFGALAAVYRHVGNNAKIGIGYNFGEFSDDLTDLTYDDQGVFLNVIGKF
jgi:hypothetical protein